MPQATKYLHNIGRMDKRVTEYLTEGTLVEEYVLDNVSRLMTCLRECNITIRWVMLHCAPSRLSVCECVAMYVPVSVCLSVMLHTAVSGMELWE